MAQRETNVPSSREDADITGTADDVVHTVGTVGAAPVGTVRELRAYPVKSLGGRPVPSVRVLTTGLEHDRGWAVTTEDGVVLSARTAPDLRDLAATAPTAAGGQVSIAVPGQEHEVMGASADAVLSHVVGRPVRLAATTSTGTGFQEVAAVHLVSRQAVADAGQQAAEGAAGGADGGAGGEPCDVEEPRANVVLDLAPDAALETSWVGREVHLGEVVLRVTRTPRSCLGVYAEVLRPGVVGVGAPVTLG